ncbi:hypothetical protein [Streptomyces sp. SA15]|uniref:hypothetical protein n=1 Tax=Streptomyces sp. SA15 TaxID=934019 RepID=UPI00117D44C9|nr:hypothetical protein [Streptomyces sp. SA15]
MAKIDIPDSLGPGALREYLEWLRDLHDKAGQPGAREIGSTIGCSHATVTRLFKSYPSNQRLAYELVKYLVSTALRPTVRTEEDLETILDKLDELLRAADPNANRAKPSGEPQDRFTETVKGQPPHRSQKSVTLAEFQRSWDFLGVPQTLVLHFCGWAPNHRHASRFDADDRLSVLGDRTGVTTYVRLCPDHALTSNLLYLRNQRPDVVLIYFEDRTEIKTDVGRTRFDVTLLQEISLLELLIDMNRPSQVLLIFEAVDCNNRPTEAAVRGTLRKIAELNRGVTERESTTASAVFIDADENGPGVPLPVLLEEATREQEESGVTHFGLTALITAAQDLMDVHFHTENYERPSKALNAHQEGTFKDYRKEPHHHPSRATNQEPPKLRESLSPYASDIAKIRDAAAAAAAAKASDKQQEPAQLYNDALSRTHSGLENYLAKKLEGTGLRLVGSVPRAPAGWPPRDYGGSANLPGWGIELLPAPWLGASIGVVHRSHPGEDLTDLGLTFILATMTHNSQHDHIREFLRFVPGSPQLDQVITVLRGKIDAALPSALAHFLSACKEADIRGL